MKELIYLKSIEDPFKSGARIRKELALDLTVQSVNRILRQDELRTYHAAKKPRVKEIIATKESILLISVRILIEQKQFS